MPVVTDVSSMDFPDGAQRFNWCTCQSAEKALARRLDGLPAVPRLTLGQVTPIVDFSFWSQLLSGGGGDTAAPPATMSAPAVSPVVSAVGQGVISAGTFLLPGALIVGAIWLYSSRKGGRRR